jgi:hypothetical protein
VTRHIFAALFLARFDGKERLVVLVLTAGPVPERSVLERLQADLDRAVVRRAIQRLRRDRVIEAVQGVLSLTSPTHWPGHRIEACERSIAAKLAPSAGNDRAAMLAVPVKPTDRPRIHQAPDNGAGDDWPWLDGERADHVSDTCATEPIGKPHPAVILARKVMRERSGAKLYDPV